jgi:hypothetical protein
VATVNELAAFLRERLDEDEPVALAAPDGPWSEDDSRSVVDAAGERIICSVNGGRLLPASNTRNHVRRHDPARVLREVEVKRKMAERHGPSDRREYSYWLCIGCGEGDPCDTLRMLAVSYADHDGYREEWRPSL